MNFVFSGKEIADNDLFNKLTDKDQLRVDASFMLLESYFLARDTGTPTAMVSSVAKLIDLHNLSMTEKDDAKQVQVTEIVRRVINTE